MCDTQGAGYLPCSCQGLPPAGATPAAPNHAPNPNVTAGSTKNPAPTEDKEGTDSRRPTLAPDDATFVDTRGGMGWNDRCWINLKKGKFGWAKAECDAALRMNPTSPMPMASILYNLGLIENAAGNVAAARSYFEQSLELREHPEVRAALIALPGGGTPRVKKQIACGSTTCDVACCATFDSTCAKDPNECPRAANGEGTIYECDGPEDCHGGEVCCLVPMDRTTASYCMKSSKCTGEYQHPRYQTSMPLEVVCHVQADCPNGKQCMSGEPHRDLALCR